MHGEGAKRLQGAQLERGCPELAVRLALLLPQSMTSLMTSLMTS